MKTGICTTIATAMILGFATLAAPVAKAQMGDVVKVNMPYAVSLGEKTMPPGDYQIKQLRDLGGGSRVLLIYSDSGMKFEAMAMTIPTYDLKTPEDTKVILSHIGNDYYFDKIWVQGKNYGYEFVLPKSVRERESEVVATNINATTTTETNTAETTTAKTTESTENSLKVENNVKVEETAVVEKPLETAPIPEPEVTPLPVPTPAESSADRAIVEEPTPAPAPEELPKTSAGWLGLLMASGGLFGTGLVLRRKR